MLMIIWPMYWLLLIPVILIEWYVSKRYLLAVASRKIFWATTTANIVSTLIGIPITWSLLAFIQMAIPGGGGIFPNLPVVLKMILSVTLQAPWLLPYERALFLMIPASMMFLLIPFFFVSVWIESLILIKVFKISSDARLVKKTCWAANLASYLLLFLFCLGVLIWSCYEHFYK